jgi:hypothetical protein
MASLIDLLYCEEVKEPRKARRSGVPDSPGWWEWFPLEDRVAKFILYVSICNDFEAKYPLDWHVWTTYPIPESELGMALVGSGRTVRTMGGMWGRKVAE